MTPKAAFVSGVDALVNIKTLLGLIVGAILALSAYSRVPERVERLEHRMEAVETSQAALLRYARQSWCIDSVVVAGGNPQSCVQQGLP
jgi:hypothetical protein